MAMSELAGRLRRRVAAGALALAAAGAAWPCGLEDPNSVAFQRGAMNLSFPKSAYVRTAIWQAQMAGDLPRDALAQRDDLSPQARGTLQLMRATRLLNTLATRLSATRDSADRPNVAIVLLGPMLWSRLEHHNGNVLAQVHVRGPEPGDAVIVTDTPAIEAIVGVGMSFEHAVELGLVRLYGPSEQVGALQTWLAAAEPR
jgi:hypothetical protein